MVVTLGQQYNIEEKPTVILYTYINHHAGTPEKQRNKRNKKTSKMVVMIYCYIGCEDEVTTLKREQTGPISSEKRSKAAVKKYQELTKTAHKT